MKKDSFHFKNFVASSKNSPMNNQQFRSMGLKNNEPIFTNQSQRDMLTQNISSPKKKCTNYQKYKNNAAVTNEQLNERIIAENKTDVGLSTGMSKYITDQSVKYSLGKNPTSRNNLVRNTHNRNSLRSFSKYIQTQYFQIVRRSLSS